MAKISNQALVELRKVRAALDDMYDKLNKPLYNKNVAAKVSYSFNLVQDNFEYISKTIRELQDSEIVGEE